MNDMDWLSRRVEPGNVSCHNPADPLISTKNKTKKSAEFEDMIDHREAWRVKTAARVVSPKHRKDQPMITTKVRPGVEPEWRNPEVKDENELTTMMKKMNGL